MIQLDIVDNKMTLLPEDFKNITINELINLTELLKTQKDLYNSSRLQSFIDEAYLIVSNINFNKTDNKTEIIDERDFNN